MTKLKYSTKLQPIQTIQYFVVKFVKNMKLKNTIGKQQNIFTNYDLFSIKNIYF